jgi:probable rRNA maturation factor
MELFFHNTTKVSIDKKEIDSIVRAAISFFKLPANTYIEVLIVGEKKINSLNKQFRDINKPTDVLSFPIFDNLSFVIGNSNIVPLGTIFVCPSVAKKRGERIIDLVIHGFMHLQGFDHETDKEASAFDAEIEKFKISLKS